jgi:DNA-binding response OmpR family regulator
MPADNPTFTTKPDGLTRREETLFALLATEPTKVWTKAAIFRAKPSLSPANVLDSTAVTLHDKLRRFDGRQSPVNVWGVGYRLQDPPTPVYCPVCNEDDSHTIGCPNA